MLEKSVENLKNVHFTEFFGIWDVLWLGIALSVAWGVPAPDEVEIGEPSEA